MKTLIWLLAIVGLATPCFLAVVHLASYWIARQYIANEPQEPGETSFLLGPTFVFGGSSANAPKLELTSSLVPPVATLVGGIVFLVGLFFLIPRQPLVVKLVVKKDGFSQLETHVQRLLRSRSDFASLGLSTPDGQHGLDLYCRNGQVEVVSLFPSVKPPDGHEELIRRYFTARNISPSQDYVPANGGVEGAPRVLSYPLPSDAQVISQVCKDIFTDIFGVGDSQGVQYDYGER